MSLTVEQAINFSDELKLMGLYQSAFYVDWAIKFYKEWIDDDHDYPHMQLETVHYRFVTLVHRVMLDVADGELTFEEAGATDEWSLLYLKVERFLNGWDPAVTL